MILLKRFTYTVLVAMIPACEIKLAIPFGLAMGLKPLLSYIAGLIGSSVILIVLAFLGQWFFDLCREKGWMTKFLNWTDRLAERNAKRLNGIGALAIFVYVAVPVPGTGTWTGAIIADVIRLKPRIIILAVLCGNIISGIIMLFIGGGIVGMMQSHIPFFSSLMDF